MRILLVLVLILIATPAYAVTQEQLKTAMVTLRSMDSTIGEMRGAVQNAFEGKVGNIDLSGSQIQTLKDRYTTGKSDLQTLFQTLP